MVLADIIGQEHLTGPEGAIGRMVAAGQIVVDDIVGPAGHRQNQHRAVARRCRWDALTMPVSAVFSGVADLKKAFAEAEKMARTGKPTLFVR